MTTQAAGGTVRARHRLRRWVLAAVEIIIATNAVYGGIGLIRDGMGMPDEWLDASPFTSWRWPGVFLLLVIAVPMAVAAVLEIARSRWAYAASLAAGLAQISWIVVQLAVLRRYFFLQPVLLGAGLMVVLLAIWSHRGQRLLSS
jgi:hypothetical protein